MNNFYQLLIEGIFSGLVYFLMASGLLIVFGVLRVVNLSHGSFFALGSYISYILYQLGQKNPIIWLFTAFIISFFLGAVLGRFLIIRIRKQKMASAVLTLAVALIFEQLFQYFCGPFSLNIQSDFYSFRIGEIVFKKLEITGIIAAFIFASIFALFLKTRWGIALKAIAEDEELGIIAGVKVKRFYWLSFGFSSAIAALSGVFLSTSLSINPVMGRMPLIFSIIVIIVSGFDNPVLTFFVGIFLGVFSSLIGSLVSVTYIYPSFLAIALILLIIRPYGLISRKIVRD